MLVNYKDLKVQTFWDQKIIEKIKDINVDRLITFIIWDNETKIITDQLQYAVENNVERIYSDILPDELPNCILPHEFDFFRKKSIFIPPSLHEINKPIAIEIIISNWENNKDKKIANYLVNSGTYHAISLDKMSYRTKIEDVLCKYNRIIINTNDPNVEYLTCLIGLRNNCDVKFITTHSSSYLRYLALGIEPKIGDTHFTIKNLRKTINETIFSKKNRITFYDKEYYLRTLKEDSLSVIDEEIFSFFSRELFRHERSEDNIHHVTEYFSILEYDNTNNKLNLKWSYFINILKRSKEISKYIINSNDFINNWIKTYINELFKVKKSIYFDKLLLNCVSHIDNIEEIFIKILENKLEIVDSPKNFNGFVTLLEDLERIKALTDESKLLEKISVLQNNFFHLHKNLLKREDTYLPDEIFNSVTYPESDAAKLFDFISDNISSYQYSPDEYSKILTYYCFKSNLNHSYDLINILVKSSRIELTKKNLFHSYITAHLNKIGLSFVELLYPTKINLPELDKFCFFMEDKITNDIDYINDIILLSILLKIKPDNTINYIKAHSNDNIKISFCFVLWYHNKNEFCSDLISEISFENIENQQTALTYLAAKSLSTGSCDDELLTCFNSKFSSYFIHNDFNLVLDSELFYYSILLKHLNKINHLLLFIRELHQRTLIHNTPKFFNFLLN